MLKKIGFNKKRRYIINGLIFQFASIEIVEIFGLIIIINWQLSNAIFEYEFLKVDLGNKIHSSTFSIDEFWEIYQDISRYN